MRKILMIAMALAIALIPLTGEAKKKKENKSKSPFGEVFEVPANEHDTEEYFGAPGIAYGNIANMGELQLLALKNAQNAVRQKIKHSYKGLITDYASTMNLGNGDNIQSKADRRGDQIIDAVVNDTQASKGPFFSEPDDKGNVTCYIGIRVYKKELAKKVSDTLSEDEELKLMFKEDEFRKRMDETFKKYKEEKQ
ncbi:MAG: hypothetical protein K2G85_09165 [Muribaculaceae bacterium]|nr:hypothetical protein [Muribaculaceae bacterium]